MFFCTHRGLASGSWPLLPGQYDPVKGCPTTQFEYKLRWDKSMCIECVERKRCKQWRATDAEVICTLKKVLSNS